LLLNNETATNGVWDEGATRFSDVLKVNNALQILNLGVYSSFIVEIAFFSRMIDTKLIDECWIEADGRRRIFEALKTNTTLKVLDLGFSTFILQFSISFDIRCNFQRHEQSEGSQLIRFV